MKRIETATVLLMVLSLTLLGQGAALAEDFYLRTQEDCGYNPGDGRGPECGRAWNKHSDIDWDNGDGTGVGPGDTLWLIGEIRDGREFVYNDKKKLGRLFYVPVDGKPGRPITIRGGHPIKPAVVVGSLVRKLARFTRQADGTYMLGKINNPKNIHAVVLGDGDNDWPVDSLCRLRRAASREAVAKTPGTFFVDGKRLFLNPGKCAGKDVAFKHQGAVSLGGHDHITVRDIKGIYFARDYAPFTPVKNHRKEGINIGLSLINCTIGFASWQPGIRGLHGAKNCLIENNTFVNVKNAIYWATYKEVTSAENIIIRGNEVYSRMKNNYMIPMQDANDAHAIGAQGLCHQCIIEKNYIHDFYGDGILFYFNKDYEVAEDTIIRWNVIENLDENQFGIKADNRGNAYWNNGIMLFGTNKKMQKSKDNNPRWKIYGNVIRNIDRDTGEKSSTGPIGTAMSIKWGRPSKPGDVIKVFGNYVNGARCGIAIRAFNVDNVFYSSANVRDNHFENISQYAVYANKPEGGAEYISFRNNKFKKVKSFFWNGKKYPGEGLWKAVAKRHMLEETGEPRGSGAAGLDYRMPLEDGGQ